MSKYIPQPEQRQLHMNMPQLRAIAVDAHTQRHVWGRRTGKTEGPGGTYTTRRIHDMPRGNGFIVGTTYEQLLTRTLPPLVAAWERLGYYEGIHYWLRKFAPAVQKIPKAYRVPLRADNYIQWYNGAGIYLVSQDRPGSINGVATQWGFGDEAKFLDITRLNEEAMLTLSGKADVFGDCPHYLSTMFMSDMPTGTKGSWLFDAEAQMDQECVDLVLALAAEEGRLMLQAQEGNPTQRQLQLLTRELAKIRGAMGELRRDLVHYTEATTMDNVHVLGLEPFRNFRRVLPDAVFKASVMNKRTVQVEHGFYASLNEETHAYDAFDYGYIDSLEHNMRDVPEKDSRWDADVDPDEPLEIAGDYNNIINSLVVGQDRRGYARLVNSMYVEHPHLLQAVYEKFCRYYRHHRAKHVIYYYDHTAVALDASRNLSYAELAIEVLIKHGWTVDRRYFGHSGSHFSRYLLWGEFLQGTNPTFPRFGYNRTNAEAVVNSMLGARTYKSGDEWKKDKSGEKINKGVPVMPPHLATHLSEAADMWAWGKLKGQRTDTHSTFVDTVGGSMAT